MRTRILVAALGTLLVAGAAGSAPLPGQQHRWNATLRAALEGQPGEAPSLVALTGEWRSTVVSVRDDSYDVRVQLSAVRLSGGQGQAVDDAQLRLVQERLATPFWITYATAGTIQLMHFQRSVPASDRNLLQTLATEMQFVGDAASRPVWNSTERDGGGTYFAIYQRSDATHVRKKKVKYLDGGAAPDPAVPAFSMAIEESEADYALSSDGAVSSLDSVQRVRLSLPGPGSNSLVTRIEFHLSDLRTSMATLDPGSAIPRDGVDHRPVAPQQSDPRVTQQEADELLLRGHSAEAILSAAGTKDAMVERRLAALFRQQPRSITTASKLLVAGPGLWAIAGALAAAGTEQAALALRATAVDTSRPAEVRVGVLMAIEGIREPSVDTMRVPVTLLDDRDPTVREAARLAAGALARTGRGRHPQEAEATDAALIARFSRASTAAEKEEYIAAMGNSGGPRTLPVLKAAIEDAHESTREAAARSLRLVPGSESAAVLAAAATSDQSATVREAALFAMGFRAPLLPVEWDAVLNAARSDAAAPVRNRAVTLLRNDPARPAGARDVLEWVAQHDEVDAIRQSATATLAVIR